MPAAVLDPTHPRRKCTEMRGSAYGIKRAGADPLYPRSLLQFARGYRAIRVPRYPRLLVTSARRGDHRGLPVVPLAAYLNELRQLCFLWQGQ